MSNDRLVQLAVELFKIGVSKSGVEELLSLHELDEVERQLAYLPYRKAKRPEAFIIEAVRRQYSPPKEFYYAHDSSQPSDAEESLDANAELPARSTPTNTEGHGVTRDVGDSPADHRI